MPCSQGKEIIVYENLKELVFLDEDQIVPEQDLIPTVRRMFSDPGFSLLGGESLGNCQRRVITTFKDILNRYKGHKVVIRTHGLVMTLMMGYFDPESNQIERVRNTVNSSQGKKILCIIGADHNYIFIDELTRQDIELKYPLR